MVVLGHAISTSGEYSSLRSLIYLIHMPVFFIVAGFLFEYKRNGYNKLGIFVFAKRKAITLLVPYVSFSVLLFVVLSIASKIQVLSELVDKIGTYNPSIYHFIYSMVLYVEPVDEHLWFSYVMFWVLMIAYLLRKTPKVYLFPVLCLLYFSTFIVSYPELIWKIFRYTLLFYVGELLYCMDKKYDFEKVRWYILVLFIVFGSMYFACKNMGIFLIVGIVKLFAEVTGSLLIIGVSKYLESRMLLRKIYLMGRESYSIYLLHQPYIVPIVVVIIAKMGLIPIVGIFIATLLGIVVPLFISKNILVKSKLLSIMLLGGH